MREGKVAPHAHRFAAANNLVPEPAREAGETFLLEAFVSISERGDGASHAASLEQRFPETYDVPHFV